MTTHELKAVPLHGAKARGRVMWVSTVEDYDLLMARRWHVKEEHHPNGRIDGPYAVSNASRADIRAGRPALIYAHCLLTGWKGVDHVNNYGLDCTRRNMRKATKAQNGYNRSSTIGSSSRYKGVSGPTPSGKWRADIRAGGIRHYLGRFATPEAARDAYNAKAAELHGEFARTDETKGRTPR
jgi:hypothetical protein